MSLPSLPGLVTDFLASSGEDVSYGFAIGETESNYPYSNRDLFAVDPKIEITKSSLLVPFLFSAFTGAYHTTAPATLEAKETFEWTKYFIVGDGTVQSVLDELNKEVIIYEPDIDELDGDLEVLKLLSSTSAKIAQGEVLQLQHKGEADLLEETYIDIINLKTAALFSAATKTGACISGSNEKEKKALESYGRNLGLAFQIADDALDYYAKEKFFGKEIGKDFYEGKVTLPLITIFQKGNEEEKEFLMEIMKKDKRTEEDFSETLALIFKYKAVETSLKKAEYFVNVSYDALAIFPDSEDKRILQNLTSFSLNRSF